MKKKLKLNKITIAALNIDEMEKSKAGYTLPEDTNCDGTQRYSCPGTVCCSPTHDPEFTTCNTFDSVYQCPLLPGQ